MYDKDLSIKWRVEIDFDEDETHTHATVRAQCGEDQAVTTLGDAFRNPKDSRQTARATDQRYRWTGWCVVCSIRDDAR